MPIAIVPLYNGETSPKRIRGALLVLYQIQIISGFVQSSVMDPHKTDVTSACLQHLHELRY